MNAAPSSSRLPVAAVVLAAALLAFAFVAAPASCEWGLTAYFWGGVVATLAMLAAPFRWLRGRPLATRFGMALLYGAGSVGVWFAGLFAANVQIMCRLF
ncbi:MAG TPA: hypothetical protein VFY24_16680 [Azospira sp.]|nr:hypothetical protein [Azospira sp.]